MGFTEVITWAIGISLVVAALLTVVRIITGPSVLDRVVGSDVLVSIVVCGLGAETALVEGTSTMPLLISLSLVGFMGSVAVSRFVARDRDYPVDFDDEPQTLEGEGAGDMEGAVDGAGDGLAGAEPPGNAQVSGGPDEVTGAQEQQGTGEEQGTGASEEQVTGAGEAPDSSRQERS